MRLLVFSVCVALVPKAALAQEKLWFSLSGNGNASASTGYYLGQWCDYTAPAQPSPITVTGTVNITRAQNGTIQYTSDSGGFATATSAPLTATLNPSGICQQPAAPATRPTAGIDFSGPLDEPIPYPYYDKGTGGRLDVQFCTNATCTTFPPIGQIGPYIRVAGLLQSQDILFDANYPTGITYGHHSVFVDLIAPYTPTPPPFTAVLQDPRPLVVDFGGPSGPTFSLPVIDGCCRSVLGATSDGVSHLLLRISTAVPVQLTLATSHPGSLKSAAGSPQVNSAGASTLSVVPTDGVAWALYKVPEDLALLYSADRRVAVVVTDPETSARLGYIDIQLKRPPVLLLHGFWSDASSWDDFVKLITQGPPFSVNARFVRPNLDLSTARLTPGAILSAIAAELQAVRSDYLDVQNIIAGRVDVVAKSTGGPVARLWMNDARYRQSGNFFSGDFHRVITAAADHGGSFLANLLIDWQEGKTAVPAPSAAIRKRFADSGLPIDGTILDLGTASAVLCGIPQTTGRFHTVAGNPMTGGTNNLPFSLLLSALGLAPVFPPGQHDGVITTGSALGALTGSQTDLMALWHEVRLAPSGAQVMDRTQQFVTRVVDLLRAPASGPLYAATFPQLQCAQPSAPASPPALPPSAIPAITLGGIPATSTLNSTLSVTAAGDGGDPLTSVLFVWDDGSVFDSAAPFAASVQLKHAGRIHISAIGVTASGAIAGGDAYVNVSGNGAVSAMSFTMARLTFPSAAGQHAVAVQLTYTGGTLVTIDDAAFGVNLVSSNPAVATIDANFKVSAVAPGTTTITASFEGKTANLAVTVEAGGEASTTLIRNGNFSSGLTFWSTFATPIPSYLVTALNNGVLEFYRVPPAPGTENQAVVLQNSGVSVPSGTSLLGQFDLGNSSTVRKRISVLIHDSNFLDLSVCTFWLAPNAPLRTYTMRTHTSQAWVNATISFYAATAGSDGGFYQLANVSLSPSAIDSGQATDCGDPTAPVATATPAGANLIVNGDFAAGMAPWNPFFDISANVTAGVAQFIRPGALNVRAGGLIQITGQPVPAATVLTSTFDLGNSSSVRKRVTILLHDQDFADLSACTFWLEPGQPLSPYSMRSFTTKPWVSASFSIYGATIGPEQWTTLDNITLAQTPSATIVGTECHEPGASVIPSPGQMPAPDAPQSAPAAAAYALGPPAVQAEAPGLVLDFSGRSGAIVSLDSWFLGGDALVYVQISIDGEPWRTVAVALTSDGWLRTTIDLSTYADHVIRIRLLSDDQIDDSRASMDLSLPGATRVPARVGRAEQPTSLSPAHALDSLSAN